MSRRRGTSPTAGPSIRSTLRSEGDSRARRRALEDQAMFRATLRDLSSRALRLVPQARPADTSALGLLRRPRPRTIAEHHKNVLAVGCVVTRLPNPMLHYCHDGSIARIATSL